jgi:hypothetical protein
MMKFASLVALFVSASECGNQVADGEALFPTEARTLQKTYSVDYAMQYDITYGSNFKVLNNFPAAEQYVLTMCDTEKPTDDKVDAVSPLQTDFTRKHFTVPLQSYGTDTTGPVGKFAILDVVDRQKYVTNLASHPCLQKALGCDDTMMAAGWGEDAKLAEQIESVDGFFRDYGNAASEKTIAVHSYLDPHVLNRAEWIKFVAAFFNKEDVAEKHMEEEEKKWETLTKEGASHSTTPRVAFIGASSWSGEYQISLAAYKMSLVAAAGGKSFATSDFSSMEHAVITGTTNPTIGFNMTDPAAKAAYQAALADVDVLIDETYHWDPASYNAESFATNFGFDGAGATIFREDGVLNPNGGMDWFEGAYANPSVLLSDLVAAIHATDGKRVYFRKLDETPTILTPEDCDTDLPVCGDVDAPATIEAPCQKYRTCPDPTTAAAADDAATTAEPVTEDQSGSFAVGLLMVAAALA